MARQAARQHGDRELPRGVRSGIARDASDERRHRHLPRHQPRARHGDRADAQLRPRAAHDLAPRHRSAGPRSDRHPRRLLLRRLSALRRDGGAVAGDGRGARARRARRLRARRLQRLPDPDRGRPAARRAAAQRRRCASCRSDCHLRVERTDTVFTARYQRGEVFRAPMAHGDGNYFADDATLDRLEGEGLVAFRYATPTAGDAEANRNGSARNIAGILSPNLRVLGLMPHPEDLVDPLMGGDGRQAAVRQPGRGAGRMTARAVDAALARGIRPERRGIRARAGDHGPRADADRARHLLA